MEPIREELNLFQGPLSNGCPTWIIHDPINDRYMRISWIDARILSLWNLGDPEKIAQKISSDTAIECNAQTVIDLYGFMKTANLLQSYTPEDSKRFAKRNEKEGWLKWLVHHYLFIRIPVFNPDKFLSVFVKTPIFSRLFLIVCILTLFFDIASIASLWPEYSSNFMSFFTPSGIFMGMLAIYISKIFHELGHGSVAKYLGCRVPLCGIAFLVMCPVFWTDTTSAWEIRDKKKRILIDASGMIAEIILAIFATLLWLIIPESPLRHFMFILSSTTWIMALAVNLSPLMRFDGYHILADLLDIPNLMQRAFDYTKWKIRRILIGIHDSEPDDFTSFQKKAVIIYSISTWIYRFGLFMGIALVVYHAVFRTLGLVLMGIEIGCFIVLPVIKELRVWFKFVKERNMSKRFYVTATLLSLLIVMIFVPFSGSVVYEAVMTPSMRFDIIPSTGIVEEIVHNGQTVKKGDNLVVVSSPEKEHDLAQAKNELKTATDTFNDLSSSDDRTTLQDTLLKQKKALSKISTIQNQINNMTVKAPFSGMIVDRNDDIEVGTPVSEHDKSIGRLVSGPWVAHTYVSEHDVQSLKVGNKDLFIMPGYTSVNMTVQSISVGSVKTLKEKELSSVYKGNTQSRVDSHSQGDVVADSSVYDVVLKVDDNNDITRQFVGRVKIFAKHKSFASRIFNNAISLFIRESDI